MGLTALAVPLLTFLAPKWLSISGIGPSWAVLWLLPWALVMGPVSASIAGLCLGLVVDGIAIGQITQVPVLIGLGFWWGRLGRRGPRIERSLNLGLLALIGAFVVGLSVWIQNFFLSLKNFAPFLIAWGFHTLLCQAVITGLLAPIICSLLLIFFRKRYSSF